MSPILGMKPSPEQQKIDREQTWVCMGQFYKEGVVRAVGVSNYNLGQLEEVLEIGDVKPQVNQVLHTPVFQQKSLLEAADRLGVHIQSYSSLGSSSNSQIMTNRLINEMAEKYKKTTAQILLRWNLQQGLSVLPKSRNMKHQKQNIDLSFVIKKSDMRKLSSLVRYTL